MGLRIIFYIVCFILAFSYLMWYGRRVKKDKSHSVMPDDPFILEEDNSNNATKINRKHILIGFSSFILFGMILYAVQTMDWGLIEMTGGFFYCWPRNYPYQWYDRK